MFQPFDQWGILNKGCRGRDRMVVEYTTTYKCLQSVPITTDLVSSNLDQGEMYNIML